MSTHEHRSRAYSQFLVCLQAQALCVLYLYSNSTTGVSIFETFYVSTTEWNDTFIECQMKSFAEHTLFLVSSMLSIYIGAQYSPMHTALLRMDFEAFFVRVCCSHWMCRFVVFCSDFFAWFLSSSAHWLYYGSVGVLN